jgi:CheY-like chemotaxis protein
MTTNSVPSIKVLCVDDSPSDLLLCQTSLARMGFDVMTATGGVAAIDLIRQHFFDVAVLDYHMPGVNGLELAQQIREIRGQLPIILFSGELPEEARGCLWIDRAVDKNDGTGALLRALREIMNSGNPQTGPAV